MDDTRFDEITRIVGKLTSRRTIVAAGFAGIGAVALGRFGLAPANAAACRRPGAACQPSGRPCCGGARCRGVCVAVRPARRSAGTGALPKPSAAPRLTAVAPPARTGGALVRVPPAKRSARVGASRSPNAVVVVRRGKRVAPTLVPAKTSATTARCAAAVRIASVPAARSAPMVSAA